jgi:hypothetical protein
MLPTMSSTPNGLAPTVLGERHFVVRMRRQLQRHLMHVGSGTAQTKTMITAAREAGRLAKRIRAGLH